MRYAAEIAYDGGKFSGWQTQPNSVTVQESLESVLFKLSGVKVPVAGAGRTDSGVHAKAQVCSFDLPYDKSDIEPRRLKLALNSNLPDGISVMKTSRVRDDFHARFDAKSREYKYFIWNSSSIYPHIKPVSCWIKQGGYDWRSASYACRFLEGEHDFGSFCRKADRPSDSVRTVYKAHLRKHGDMIIFSVKANGFLTNMVRIMLGNLEKVAKGQYPPEWISSLLKPNAVRNDGGRTFPPCGLFLWKINYDEDIWKLPE